MVTVRSVVNSGTTMSTASPSALKRVGALLVLASMDTVFSPPCRFIPPAFWLSLIFMVEKSVLYRVNGLPPFTWATDR